MGAMKKDIVAVFGGIVMLLHILTASAGPKGDKKGISTEELERCYL